MVITDIPGEGCLAVIYPQRIVAEVNPLGDEPVLSLIIRDLQRGQDGELREVERTLAWKFHVVVCAVKEQCAIGVPSLVGRENG